MADTSPGLMRQILSRGVFTNKDYGSDTSRRRNIDRCVCFVRVRKTCQYSQAKNECAVQTGVSAHDYYGRHVMKDREGGKETTVRLWHPTEVLIHEQPGGSRTFSYHSLGYYDANC